MDLIQDTLYLVSNWLLTFQTATYVEFKNRTNIIKRFLFFYIIDFLSFLANSRGSKLHPLQQIFRWNCSLSFSRPTNWLGNIKHFVANHRVPLYNKLFVNPYSQLVHGNLNIHTNDTWNQICHFHQRSVIITLYNRKQVWDYLK